MVLVSVIMPARNAAETIAAALISVQAQSEQNWELIVIDDASSDDTAGIVRAARLADPRIVLMENDTAPGAAAARNVGIMAAKGRYIAFLDADDQWFPDKLTRQISLMEQTDAPLCYAGFMVARPGREEREVTVPPSITYERLLKGNIIGCLTAIYDTRMCGKRLMPLIRRRHDFALWLQILKAHGVAFGVTEPQARLRVSPKSLSANKVVATYDTWRMHRDVIGLSLMESSKNTVYHMVQRLLR